MTQFVCENILKRAQQFDEDARISSVSRRDMDDGILVRVATKVGNGPSGLVQALRDQWPLASVSLVQNLVDGHTEAQVLLPNESEQRHLAKIMAQLSGGQDILRKVANVLIAILAAVCVHQAVDITRD
jgi:hypothetical protein|tara:strand:+ start:1904 stop:2287 length:384 start_codon:yes stop_codon:yes gene_type:complete